MSENFYKTIFNRYLNWHLLTRGLVQNIRECRIFSSLFIAVHCEIPKFHLIHALIFSLYTGICRGVFKTLLNIQDWAFQKIVNGPQPLFIFTKSSILDALQSSQYPFDTLIRKSPIFVCFSCRAFAKFSIIVTFCWC